jgi:LuxR family maltose regulon positive regulatory protein
LREAQPEQLPALHRRASEWFALNDLPIEAVRHALAARDFERAANLVEVAWLSLSRSRQDALLRGWLKALPHETIRRRPVLSVYAATVLLLSGDLAEVERHLLEAERWQETHGVLAEEPVVASEEEFRRLPVLIAIGRAGLAQARGDFASTIHFARQAWQAVQPGDHIGRAGAAGFLGLALWASGDLAAAQQVYAESVISMYLSGNQADALSGTMALAEMQIVCGRLREARHTLEQASLRATAQAAPVPKATADLMVALSELDREHNDLATAETRLLESKSLGEHASLPENRYRWPVAMARLRAAQGDLEAALNWLGEAERLYMRGFIPETRPIGALRAGIWIALGRLTEATSWAQAQGLTAQDEPDYGREVEHLTLTRLLIAQYRATQQASAIRGANDLLARLLAAAEAGGRTGSVNEILVLQALAHAAQGALPEALVPLERALAQAEPEGYVRLFVDEGQPMLALLRAAAQRGAVPSYARRLIAAFGEAVPPSAVAQPTTARQSLPEPLSERELEVLRLLGTELSGPEIARQLMVSLNTFQTHTKNIYGKLGVSGRRAAVRRAEELNLK